MFLFVRTSFLFGSSCFVLHTQVFGQEALSFKRLFGILVPDQVCLRGRLREPRLMFGVGHKDAIQHPAGADREVINITEPLLAKPSLGSGPGAVKPVHNVTKVLRAVVRPEGKAPRQELP